ncbi:glycosyltransferase family 4 protein [Candidatus Chloroploca asiatica]|uniref:Glycosyl transferase family 1 n=1 Tax=Candidatus Chloroploca asiatica TaxID=1506545 RepID=A0A2H3L903_9CHLR|nr:glycosyltransferase family 4 protein [Candidatus Chloroploca asiatica]PDV99800.1 glycosyl transferase family 1 [Candidatus Chloroploca asiatica]
MRILMLNNEFPPLGGGTGTVNRAILARLADVPGLQIDLVTSALGRAVEHEQFAERVRIYKVPVRNRNLHHSSNRELLTYAARALPLALRLQRRHPYDAVFAWSAVPAGGVALALRKLTGLPYLVRVCGPDIPGFERRYGPLYPVLTPVIKAIWLGASHLVAKCQGEAEMMLAVAPGLTIDLIPNGVDLAQFPQAPIHDDGPLHLLSVARLIERKGQHHLIEAVRRLVAEGYDVVLELVGTGDAEPALREQAEQAGVSQRVQFAGYVPREAIPGRYAAAHVFVLASFNEGMSVATLESMAAGLPAVVTKTSGTDELIDDGVSGFRFAWADLEALTEYLRHFANDRTLARQMGDAARMRARAFTWEHAAARYLAIFERGLSR